VLVDSHCHLADAAFAEDREAVVARARAAGVTRVVVVADSVASSRTARELCTGRSDLVASAGVHPHHASDLDATAARELEALIEDPGTVAVGETGLDYHYERSSRGAQREAFAWHLAAAGRTGKPAIVHAREADADVARALTDAPSGIRGVLHCFSAGREVLEAGLARGFCVSFSGMVTFRNWDQRWAVEAVPDAQLLVETDAPFLAPVPHRGRRNEPAFVTHTAARLAELRGTSPERLAALTTDNANRLFGLLP
jgi:TatD DNase family protein